MKTREPPPERGRAKGAGKEKRNQPTAESAQTPMQRFRRLASGVVPVSPEKLRAEEEREKKRKKS